MYISIIKACASILITGLKCDVMVLLEYLGWCDQFLVESSPKGVAIITPVDLQSPDSIHPCQLVLIPPGPPSCMYSRILRHPKYIFEKSARPLHKDFNCACKKSHKYMHVRSDLQKFNRINAQFPHKCIYVRRRRAPRPRFFISIFF